MFDKRLLICSINDERVKNSIVRIDLRIQMALPVTTAEERIAMDSLCSREMDGIELRCSRIHAHYDRSQSIEVADCVDCEVIAAFPFTIVNWLRNTFVCYHSSYTALMNRFLHLC